MQYIAMGSQRARQATTPSWKPQEEEAETYEKIG
jgi:hypothetical protein